MQRRKFSRQFKLEAVRLAGNAEFRSRKRRAVWMCMRMSSADGAGSSAPVPGRRSLAMAR